MTGDLPAIPKGRLRSHAGSSVRLLDPEAQATDLSAEQIGFVYGIPTHEKRWKTQAIMIHHVPSGLASGAGQGFITLKYGAKSWYFLPMVPDKATTGVYQ